jgi:hypothetical protein
MTGILVALPLTPSRPYLGNIDSQVNDGREMDRLNSRNDVSSHQTTLHAHRDVLLVRSRSCKQ